MRNISRILISLLMVVVLGSGFRWIYLQWHQVKTESAVGLPDQASLNQLWQTTLYDDMGKTYRLDQYKGKPMIVNFWATWCEPCREEMPEISALAEAYPEVQVLGLAIDDAAAVHEFIESIQVKYPLLIAENEGMFLAEALGNNKGVLPYTVIISADGKVTRVFFGRVNRQLLLSALNLS